MTSHRSILGVAEAKDSHQVYATSRDDHSPAKEKGRGNYSPGGRGTHPRNLVFGLSLCSCRDQAEWPRLPVHIRRGSTVTLRHQLKPRNSSVCCRYSRKRATIRSQCSGSPYRPPGSFHLTFKTLLITRLLGKIL